MLRPAIHQRALWWHHHHIHEMHLLISSTHLALHCSLLLFHRILCSCILKVRDHCREQWIRLDERRINHVIIATTTMGPALPQASTTSYSLQIRLTHDTASTALEHAELGGTCVQLKGPLLRCGARVCRQWLKSSACL